MALSLIALTAQPAPIASLVPPFIGFPRQTVSPLMVADRLLTLAQDADRAGFPETAADLVTLVYSVLEARH